MEEVGGEMPWGRLTSGAVAPPAGIFLANTCSRYALIALAFSRTHLTGGLVSFLAFPLESQTAPVAVRQLLHIPSQPSFI